MNTDTSDILRAAIDTLRERVPALSSVKGYAGEFRRGAEQVPLRVPAAYVALEGSSVRGLVGGAHEERLHLKVYLAGRADRINPGARPPEAALVMNALKGSALGLSINPLVLLAVSNIGSAGNAVLYSIEFECSFQSLAQEAGQ